MSGIAERDMPIVTAIWMPAIEQWLVALPGGRDALRSDERAVEELVAAEATGACVKYVIPRLVPTPSSGPDFAAAGYAVQQRQGPSPAPARGVEPSSPAAAYPPVAVAGTITAGE